MSRSTRMALLLLCTALCLPTASQAKEVPLNRQDVTVIKKKLVAVEAALGSLPEGYTKNDEDFGLPTSVDTSDKGGFRPVYASANFTFDGGSEKLAQQSEKEFEAEYRRKMMEAQASGNYAAIQELSQEMIAKAMGAQMAAEDAKREPVRVYVSFNNGTSATIDPDAVVFEKPGVIALKSLQNQGDQMQVMIYFDPVSLKETETLSQVELDSGDIMGGKAKTTVRNITIDMSGPPDVVEAWSKSIATDQVLAQIDK